VSAQGLAGPELKQLIKINKKPVHPRIMIQKELVSPE